MDQTDSGNDYNAGKRNFLKQSLKVGIVSGVSFGLLGGSKDEKDEDEISPAEDLMREHGLLNRVLLIYDCCKGKLIKKESFPLDSLLNSANIIRTFIEDYHEKQEEQYLFPRFEKANQLTELVKTLRIQHQAGRRITDEIVHLASAKILSDDEHQKLIMLISDFNSMYRPHEAREDTVLFPTLTKIVSKHEYAAMGEDFEKNEHKLFGEDGFETMVEKVSVLEKQLGIYDLSLFTPKE